MAMLIQTKDVIDRLRSAGLQRSDFIARCERIMRGRTFVGYGDVFICLMCSLDKQRALAPEIAKQGFRVVINTIDGKPIGSVSVYEKGKPGLIYKELA